MVGDFVGAGVGTIGVGNSGVGAGVGGVGGVGGGAGVGGPFGVLQHFLQSSNAMPEISGHATMARSSPVYQRNAAVSSVSTRLKIEAHK